MKAIVCALVIGLIVPSFASAAIENIQISNNNFVAVTISWTTDSDAMGEVHYSESPGLLNPVTVYDVRGQFVAGCTHYVEITGLTAEKIYYFEVKAGGEIDDNGGNYYTFTTMKQPGSPPTPCTITGCVYEEDGTTLAVGPVVYLWVTHGGVESYPLSDLLSDGDATPGCFAFDIKQTRSTATHDLFPSIDPDDPIHVGVMGCGNYQVARDLVFDACFGNIGFLVLDTTTTTTSIPVTTTVPTTTPTTAPTTTPTTVPTTTPTTVPTTTPTTVPTTTPTTAPTTTPTTAPTTTPTTAPTTSVPGGGCTTDAECDDGVYCNGAETCDPEAGCRPGSPPCTADGAFCNGVEGCDEEADACVSSGDPCEENETCNEEDDTCTPKVSIESSITGCGFPLFARFGVVEIQGTGTDFKSLSVVSYDSPLVLKLAKLMNRKTQTITQFVILWPSFGSIFFSALDYPATVTVTVDTLSDTFEIPACGR
jgi:hypothetical protein